jgi:prepilin-type N-terminal cleavage/methylation domain-containing protein
MITTKAPAQKRLEQRKKGFTLTEIAIVLGIMGLVLGAIWVAASGVYSNQKVTKANTELMAVVQGIRSLYATQNQVAAAAGTDLTTALIRSGVFPSDTLSTGNPQTAVAPGQAPWTNGTIWVYSSTVANAGDAFQVQFNGIPQTACINLLTAAAGAGRDQSLMQAAGRGGAAPITTYLAYAATVLPLTAVAAAAACPANPFTSAILTYQLQ